MIVEFKKLRDGALLPEYKTAGSSGFDIAAPGAFTVPAGTTVLLKTGLACAVPVGYEMQLRARSGIAYKTPLIVKNGVGTIDSDYRGEIGILLHNLGNEDVEFAAGERIAQGVICPVVHVEIKEVDTLDETERGAGGFGHTGMK